MESAPAPRRDGRAGQVGRLGVPSWGIVGPSEVALSHVAAASGPPQGLVEALTGPPEDSSQTVVQTVARELSLCLGGLFGSSWWLFLAILAALDGLLGASWDDLGGLLGVLERRDAEKATRLESFKI